MEKLNTFTIAFYLICLFLLGLTFILILTVLNSKKRLLLDVKKKELDFESSLNMAQLISIEEERRKIGSTLHDDLGQILNLIHMQLSELKKAHKNNDHAIPSIQLIEKLCTNASEKCSYISKMLFPATLIRLGFIDGLHELISDIQLASGIHIIFKYDDFIISDNRASNLYRIFQELFNNTLKHAQAKTINISILKCENGIKVDYSDDGIGVDKNYITEGLGTTTIKTRLHILECQLIEHTEPISGFQISFIMPNGKN